MVFLEFLLVVAASIQQYVFVSEESRKYSGAVESQIRDKLELSDPPVAIKEGQPLGHAGLTRHFARDIRTARA